MSTCFTKCSKFAKVIQILIDYLLLVINVKKKFNVLILGRPKIDNLKISGSISLSNAHGRNVKFILAINPKIFFM